MARNILCATVANFILAPKITHGWRFWVSNLTQNVTFDDVLDMPFNQTELEWCVSYVFILFYLFYEPWQGTINIYKFGKCVSHWIWTHVLLSLVVSLVFNIVYTLPCFGVMMFVIICPKFELFVGKFMKSCQLDFVVYPFFFFLKKRAISLLIHSFSNVFSLSFFSFFFKKKGWTCVLLNLVHISHHFYIIKIKIYIIEWHKCYFIIIEWYFIFPQLKVRIQIHNLICLLKKSHKYMYI